MRLKLSEKDIFSFLGVFRALSKEVLEPTMVSLEILAGQRNLEAKGESTSHGLAWVRFSLEPVLSSSSLLSSSTSPAIHNSVPIVKIVLFLYPQA